VVVFLSIFQARCAITYYVDGSCKTVQAGASFRTQLNGAINMGRNARDRLASVPLAGGSYADLNHASYFHFLFRNLPSNMVSFGMAFRK
jgi:hypothetical protein